MCARTARATDAWRVCLAIIYDEKFAGERHTNTAGAEAIFMGLRSVHAHTTHPADTRRRRCVWLICCDRSCVDDDDAQWFILFAPESRHTHARDGHKNRWRTRARVFRMESDDATCIIA